MTTLRELAAAVRERRVGSHELVAESLRRIEALDPDLGAVVALRPEALDDARVLDGLILDGEDPGPLAGLPLLVKDITDVAGMRTTFGSRGVRGAAPAAMDAAVVARLRAAGAVVVGKTNTPEFAAAGYTTNLLFGPTRNPWDRERNAGGSSGGSAAALAAGLAADRDRHRRWRFDPHPRVLLRSGGAQADERRDRPRSDPELARPLDRRPVLRCTPTTWRSCSTCCAVRSRATRPRCPAWAGRPPVEPTTLRVVALDRLWDDAPLPDVAAVPFARAVARFAEVFGVDVERPPLDDPYPDASMGWDWFLVCACEHAHHLGRAWVEAHHDELTEAVASFLDLGFGVSAEEYLGCATPPVRLRARCLDAYLGDDGLLLTPVMAVDACPADGPGPGARVGLVRDRGAEHHRASGALAAGRVVPERRAVRSAGHRAAVPRRPVARRGAPWEEAEPWPLVAPGYEPFGVIAAQPDRSQSAASLAWYVRIRSAPARRIDVRSSSTTRRSSIQPFMRCGLHHRVLAAHVVGGHRETGGVLRDAHDVQVGERRLHHHDVGALLDVGDDLAQRFVGVRRILLVAGPVAEPRCTLGGLTERRVEPARELRRVGDDRRRLGARLRRAAHGWPPPVRPSSRSARPCATPASACAWAMRW